MQTREKPDTAQHAARPLNGLSPDARDHAVPIIVGVTGHRDLRPDDEVALEEKVAAFFEQKQREYPNTPLILLSPLAEGADRLVARVALAHDVKLVVPLPMARAEYEKDFETKESRDEFAELLSRASNWLEMPLGKGVEADKLETDPEMRNLQYVQVGAFIVLHCQFLIALWDGKQPEKPGGTAQIVQFQLEGLPEEWLSRMAEPSLAGLSLLDAPENGPVYQVVTPRQSDPSASSSSITARTILPEVVRDKEQEWASYHRQMLKNMDVFNRDAANFRSHHPKEVEKAAKYLIADDETRNLPPHLVGMRAHFAQADAAAIHYQRRTYTVLSCLVAVVFTAMACLEWFAHIDHEYSTLWFYPAFLALAFVIYSAAKSTNLQNKHQDYRAFAEGLRVQFFWSLAGIPTCVAEHYLRKQRSELDWIRIALRTLYYVSGTPNGGLLASKQGSILDEAERIRLVQEFWIEDQRKYFDRAIDREEAALARHEMWTRVCFLASPVIALGLAGGAMVSPRFSILLNVPISPSQHHSRPLDILVMVIVLSAVYAALVHWHADKKALAQHKKQYKRMELLFAVASKNMFRCLADRDYPKACFIIQELGKEALAENGDWVLTHRDRPLEVPEAG